MLAGQHLTERVRLLDDASVATVPRSLRLNLRVAVVTICAYAEAYPGVWMQLWCDDSKALHPKLGLFEAGKLEY